VLLGGLVDRVAQEPVGFGIVAALARGDAVR
jgi:hypothetical protein